MSSLNEIFLINISLISVIQKQHIMIIRNQPKKTVHVKLKLFMNSFNSL